MTPSLTLSFGAWLKEQRQIRRLTQEALAEQIGCAPETLRKFEAGRRQPSQQLAGLLAAALAVPPAARPAFVQWARGGLAAPPLAAPPPRPFTLPAALLPIPATALIGRAAEIGSVRALLWRANVRLITLTGPPGIGKTRLALAVAEAARADFTDGAVFVSLAPLTDAALVAPTIAAALGLGGQADPQAALRDRLRDKHLLLVLDNFEQLLPAAEVVTDLLQAAAGLKVLVTSRAALGRRGERQIVVSLLPTPDSVHPPPLTDLRENPAVALFLARAQEVNADFALTPDNAATVAAICARLEGLPLAVELAAAKIKILSPAALLARLEHRLTLLTGGWHDLPPHQQSLRAAIDWSYDLLDPAAQTLFRRLGVFAGGAPLLAIEAIAGALGDAGPGVLASLESLVNGSLVRGLAELDVQGASDSRFTLLESIREYTLERLEASGEAAATRRAHATYYLALAEKAEAARRTAQQAGWPERLERDHDNYRVALAWALHEGEALLLLRMSNALWSLWNRRGYLREGQQWLRAALAAAPTTATVHRAQALSMLGMLVYNTGDATQALTYYATSLVISQELDDKQGIMETLNNMAYAVEAQGNLAQALQWQEEILVLARELGDRWSLGRAIYQLGRSWLRQNALERAEALVRESLVIAQDVGDRVAVACAFGVLGHVARRRGAYDQAAAFLSESQEVYQEIGSRRGAVAGGIPLALVRMQQGDYRQAAALLAEGLALFRETGDIAVADCLEAVAQLRLLQGDGAPAARLLSAATALRTADNVGVIPFHQADYEHVLGLIRAQLAEDVFAAAWAAGQALSREEAVAEAWPIVATLAGDRDG